MVNDKNLWVSFKLLLLNDNLQYEPVCHMLFNSNCYTFLHSFHFTSREKNKEGLSVN